MQYIVSQLHSSYASSSSSLTGASSFRASKCAQPSRWPCDSCMPPPHRHRKILGASFWLWILLDLVDRL